MPWMMMNQETKNVLHVSLTMMIFFTAALSHEFIQEPLIAGLHAAQIGEFQATDGYMSLCIIYAFNTISCTLTPFLVNRISGKWAMVVGMIAMLCFQASFLYPHRLLLITASIIVGIGITFYWVGQGQYITENVSVENMEKNTSLQWALFKTSLINGGLLFLLLFQGASIQDIVLNGTMHFFISIFMACTVVSIVSTTLLPQSEMSQNRGKIAFLKVAEDCLKLMRTPRMICLSFFFTYTGFFRAFWVSIYPACIRFTSQLSVNTTFLLALGMLVTGIGQVLGSAMVIVLGSPIRKKGEHLLVIFALILHSVLFLLIGLSFPNDAPFGHTDKLGPVLRATVFTSMLFFFFLGFGDAILQTQVYTYIAEYYKEDSSSAFSVFRCFSGISSSLLFLEAQFFSLTTLLTILFTSLLFAAAAIFNIERIKKKEENSSAIVVIVPTHSNYRAS